MAVKTLAEVMAMSIDDRVAYLRGMTPEEMVEASGPWKDEWSEATRFFRTAWVTRPLAPPAARPALDPSSDG